MRSIDVHGCIKVEAEVKIRSFIKECYQNREYFALIIHGSGLHVLQKATHKICDESKYIEKYE